MTGLRLMNEIMDPSQREQLSASVTARSRRQQAATERSRFELQRVKRRVHVFAPDIAIPPAPYLDRKARALPLLAEIWTYINPYMLYGRNLGFKGNFADALHERDDTRPRAIPQDGGSEARRREVDEAARSLAIHRSQRAGNSIHLFSPGAVELIHTFRFGRQAKPDGLCLSDYVLDADEGRRDHIVLLVVTAGENVREHVEEAKVAGEYFKAHATQALATETAEACAEWLHRRIREEWGFPDPPAMTMQERFTSKYRGKRYSFGYGACPNMDDQQGIWKLLHPEEIGVHLTTE